MNKSSNYRTAVNPSANIVKSYAPYTVPFVLLAIFIYLGPLLDISKGLLYPLQTIVIAASIVCFWKYFKTEIRFTLDLTAIFVGVAVFLIWVLPEGLYPQVGHSEFNPYDFADGELMYLLIACRLTGAVLVIPIMEELFWRSFALRFLIKSQFKEVPLGHFNWFSFAVVSLAFGFAHHRWLPGIIAGAAYAAVLYRSKNLFSPILAHAVTNLLLGVYVIGTGKWHFW
jgi:CAAX protease family protein